MNRAIPFCVMLVGLWLCTIVEPVTAAPRPSTGGIEISFPGVPQTWTVPPLQKPKGKVVHVSNAKEFRAAVHSGVKDTIVMKIQKRNGKHTNIRVEGNVISKDESWFRNVKGYDLHLTSKATGALGKAVPLKPDPLSAVIDVDGKTRPEKNVDVGADQH